MCVRHTIYWVRQSYTGPEKNHSIQVASNNKDAKNQAEGEGSSEWMWGAGEVKNLKRTRNWRQQIYATSGFWHKIGLLSAEALDSNTPGSGEKDQNQV